MERVAEVMLNSGERMPLLGMGTATYPITPADVVESSVLAAIEMGYRHFDTASVYDTELPLGKAIFTALSLELISSREELFITTKLWPGHAHKDLVVPALRQSLRDLELDYVDLYLIHFPARFNKKVKDYDVKSTDLVALDMKGTWEAMEECTKLGLAKSIGVSNFSCEKLSQLLTCATILPAVNQVEGSFQIDQVEMHPLWQQRKLREFCEDKGIHVTAYSPLGGKGAVWGSNAVLEQEELEQIAKAKGKSVAQICLRWALEQGVSFVPKSFNKERLKENMDIFEWQLSKAELLKISRLPQGRIFKAEYLVSADGLFKSVEDMWDGEI